MKMIMNNQMVNFNVTMYNKKIAQLNRIIDVLNETIYCFYIWGHKITPTFFKGLMDRPAETFNKHISYEYISQYKYDDYSIEENEYDSPYYQECYQHITCEMSSIMEAHNKFCISLPYIKEAYDSSLFFIKEEDGSKEPEIAKTKNAEWRIMQQCAEYEDYMNEEV